MKCVRLETLPIKKRFFPLKEGGLDDLERGDADAAVTKLEAAWKLLPAPRQNVDESYHVASALIEAELARGKHAKALAWADVLQTADLSRHDDGDREFQKGVALFETGDLAAAKQVLTIANEKSSGYAFKGEDKKYKQLLEAKPAKAPARPTAKPARPGEKSPAAKSSKSSATKSTAQPQPTELPAAIKKRVDALAKQGNAAWA